MKILAQLSERRPILCVCWHKSHCCPSEELLQPQVSLRVDLRTSFCMVSTGVGFHLPCHRMLQFFIKAIEKCNRWSREPRSWRSWWTVLVNISPLLCYLRNLNSSTNGNFTLRVYTNRYCKQWDDFMGNDRKQHFIWSCPSFFDLVFLLLAPGPVNPGLPNPYFALVSDCLLSSSSRGGILLAFRGGGCMMCSCFGSASIRASFSGCLLPSVTWKPRIGWSWILVYHTFISSSGSPSLWMESSQIGKTQPIGLLVLWQYPLGGIFLEGIVVAPPWSLPQLWQIVMGRQFPRLQLECLHLGMEWSPAVLPPQGGGLGCLEEARHGQVWL